MNAEVQRRKFRMDSGHKDTEVKYTESPNNQCLEFLRKNSVELYLAYCGREICEAGHTYGPAVRQEYLLHYVISGKGTFTADGKTTELGAHDAFSDHAGGDYCIQGGCQRTLVLCLGSI